MNKFWHEYHNPYYYWWKVRKFWKIPKIHLAYRGKVTWFFGLPADLEYYNKYFDVKLSGLGKKDKEGSPRHEWDPYLCFTFFRKWQVIFTLNFVPYFTKNAFEYQTISMITWECILEMTEYNKNISDACHDGGFWSTYHSCDDHNYTIPPTHLNVLRNLTKYGFEQYCQTPRSKVLKNKCNYYD